MSFQVRQGTDAQRLTITPQSGELIYTTDTKEVFIGDGVTVGGLPVSGGNTGPSDYGNANVFSYMGSNSNVEIITSGNVVASTFRTVGTDGNISGVNYYLGNTAEISGNVTANFYSGNSAQISGNVTANYFIGDGSQLTNLPFVPTNYGNANVAAYLPTYTGKLGNSVTIAIGSGAGALNQGANAIAIGVGSSPTNQAANSIAIGTNSWANSVNSIAIGAGAGRGNQGANTVSIGHTAGSGVVGNNSVCIGSTAGSGIVGDNTIVISADDSLLSAEGPGFYVSPVREDNGNTTAAMFYNSDTDEITWSKVSTTVKTPVQVATTVSLSTLSVNGYFYDNGPGNDGQNAYIQQYATGSGTFNTLVIDGVTMVDGYRVLVKNEIGSTGVNPGLLTGKNGIYVVERAGDLTTSWKLVRADDFNLANEVPDSTVFVESGAVNRGTEWRCTTLKTDPFIMGSTSANFTNLLRQLPQTKGSSDPGVTGDICWDANYIYVCVAVNTWKRTLLTGGY